MRERKHQSELRLFLVNTSIIVIAVCLLSVVCLTTIANDLKNSQVFTSNIVVDGVPLSGMTYQEAKVLLEKRFSENINAISVKLKYAGQAFTLKGQELGFISNIEEVLDSAAKLGKQSSPYAQEASQEAYAQHRAYNRLRCFAAKHRKLLCERECRAGKRRSDIQCRNAHSLIKTVKGY